jgi:uncharacterized protein
MPNFIDRRLNPKAKSLGNRQRFLKRARAELKRSIDKQLRSGKIAEVDDEKVVPIPLHGTNEPTFRHCPDTGRKEGVLPGNRNYAQGDRIPKPPGGAGGGGGGKRATDSGESEDEFSFVLSREEVLDLFFEDLELPDMVKLYLKENANKKPRRAGYSVSGSPANINVGRTMRSSFGRRIALRRPKLEEIQAIADEIAALEAQPRPSPAILARLEQLRHEHEVLVRRRKLISFVDPIDVRYNRFEQTPVPNASAVMFCLMDVSGSMGEREKDLAKRFFMLLHLFLKRRYQRTEIVFIRHTHQAREVDENTFFYSTESGGTVVSTALEEMLRVIKARYPQHEWNIYGAQASDGDNMPHDCARCIELLNEQVMKLCQYYAYVEIIDARESSIFANTDNGTSLWQAYKTVSEAWPNFQIARVAQPGDIYTVFRRLFAKRAAVRAGA